MKLLVTVIGMVFVIEGIPYFAFPEKMQAYMRKMQDMPPGSLRVMGAFSIMAGLLLCYIALKTGLFNG